jgi:DNA recombination protein RmuC
MLDYLQLITIILLAIVLYLVLSKKDGQENQKGLLDLERRLTDLVALEMEKSRQQNSDTSRQVNDRIISFTKETTELKQAFLAVQEKVDDISSFQEIFKQPKLRGQWGEASLSYILRQYFPDELIEEQHIFSSKEAVDAVLKLPDGKLLPIDSKFSFDNFEKIAFSTNEDEKLTFRKGFISDTKLRIDETSKYILPSEGTVDFAIMYIPAEAIYYELMFGQGDESMLEYAWKKKVVICSPNTIYLSLKTIMHWVKDTQITKQTQDILKKLERISADAISLQGTFDKLGSHLKNAQSSFEDSQKRVGLLSERVGKVLDISEKKDNNLLD